jgi:hypothetical protein
MKKRQRGLPHSEYSFLQAALYHNDNQRQEKLCQMSNLFRNGPFVTSIEVSPIGVETPGRWERLRNACWLLPSYSVSSPFQQPSDVEIPAGGPGPRHLNGKPFLTLSLERQTATCALGGTIVAGCRLPRDRPRNIILPDSRRTRQAARHV